MNRLIILFLFTLNIQSFAQQPTIVFEHSILSKYSMGMFHANSTSDKGDFLDVSTYRLNLPPPSSYFAFVFKNRISLSLEYSFMNTKGSRERFAKYFDTNPQHQIVRASLPYSARFHTVNYRIHNHFLKFGLHKIIQKSKQKQKIIGANLILGCSSMKDVKIGFATLGTNAVITRNYSIKASPLLGLSCHITFKTLGVPTFTIKKDIQPADAFGIEPMFWTTLNRVKYEENNFFTQQSNVVSFNVFNFHYGLQIYYCFSNRIIGRKKII